MAPKTRFARELDVSALIALWLAIHGGDPARREITVDDETTLLIAAALDRQLAVTLGNGKQGDARELLERLEAFNIEATGELAESIEANVHCFKVPDGSAKGGYVTVCVRYTPVLEGG
jgi:hypothetical protein